MAIILNLINSRENVPVVSELIQLQDQVYNHEKNKPTQETLAKLSGFLQKVTSKPW